MKPYEIPMPGDMLTNPALGKPAPPELKQAMASGQGRKDQRRDVRRAKAKVAKASRKRNRKR